LTSKTAEKNRLQVKKLISKEKKKRREGNISNINK
jgi:hypothetical protein